mmetsp:Transcript_43577/g.65819  ORF Transcript_43577/g.65819 Transcript_43577/m.65819 type:complete len:92 (+) Transcript_43577:13-288(+)
MTDGTGSATNEAFLAAQTRCRFLETCLDIWSLFYQAGAPLFLLVSTLTPMSCYCVIKEVNTSMHSNDDLQCVSVDDASLIAAHIFIWRRSE